MEITVEDLAQLWKTDKPYLILLDRHIPPEFGDKTEITEDEVQGFVLRMLAGGLPRVRFHALRHTVSLLLGHAAHFGPGTCMLGKRAYCP